MNMKYRIARLVIVVLLDSPGHMRRLITLFFGLIGLLFCQGAAFERGSSSNSPNNPRVYRGRGSRPAGRPPSINLADPSLHDPRLLSPTGRPAIYVTQTTRGPVWHYEQVGSPASEVNLVRWFTRSLAPRPGEHPIGDDIHTIHVLDLGMVGYTIMSWTFGQLTASFEQRFHVRIVSDPATLLLSYHQATGLYINSLMITAAPVRRRTIHRGTAHVEFWPEGTPAMNGNQPRHAEVSMTQGFEGTYDASYFLSEALIADARSEIYVRVRWTVSWSISQFQPTWWDAYLHRPHEEHPPDATP